jgi:hypothetical protein
MSDLTDRLGRLAAIPTAAALGALGAVRRARAFHPTGIAFIGTWNATDDVLDPLAPTQPWPVVVRLSKGVGLPGTVPDVLGLAIRIVDLHGRGQHQDLLLASSGAGRWGRMVLRPTSDHGHAAYSSLVPYNTPVGHGVLWARAEQSGDEPAPRSLEEAAARAEAGELSFVVGIVTEDRDRLLGEVRIDERLDASAGEALRFDPENAGPPLQPTGALQELRERAYRASQRFRPTSEGDQEATEEAVAQEAAGTS